MEKEKQKSCYLCGSKDFDRLKGKVRDNKHLRVLKCKHCSLISLDSVEHITEEFYKSGQMHSGAFNPQRWEKSSECDDIRRFEFLKKNIKDKVLVDFGCGAGGFLKRARSVAEKVYGVELEEQQRKYLSSKGYAIREDISGIKEKIDIITMFHVLEHIENPIELLQKFKDKLKDENSQIVIEVPNSNDALLSLYKAKAFTHFTWWSCHLYTYNKENLMTLVKKAGYKVNYVKNIQRYGIFNHLYWLFKGKPAGHIKFAWARFAPVEFLYSKILSAFDKSDTILISISPEN